MFLFAALFVVSAAAITHTLLTARYENEEFVNLAGTAVLARQAQEIDGLLGLVSTVPKPQPSELEADNVTVSGETQSEEPQYTEYAALYAENSDFVGWLHVENTNIDYPVMFTPDDPEYYLRRAFDRTASQSGTPFISENCTIDSDFFIIYGHNMKNNTMFGTLDCYAEKSFWEENPCFSFITVSEQREYEVFAALETRVLYQDETGYRYYFQVGDLTEDAFNELTGWLQENALYNTGITPAYGEQIVVLSTCSYHESNGRFIVAARRTDNAG